MTISPNKWELDVQAYLNTCNITSATPRKQIRDFSAGVNDLGLWNSMVCWPLRSSQNYGSGTTAFSLGGLGTYNGTLVGGPTWEADGINFDGSNDYITTLLKITDLSVLNCSIASAFNLASDSVSFAFVFGQDTPGATGGAGSLRRDAAETGINFAVTLGGAQADNIQGTIAAWRIHSARVSGSTSFHGVGSSSEQSVAGAGAYNATSGDFVGFGARNKNSTPQLYAKMVNAFGAVFAADLTAQQTLGVNALYKSTLGTGLGLP